MIGPYLLLYLISFFGFGAQAKALGRNWDACYAIVIHSRVIFSNKQNKNLNLCCIFEDRMHSLLFQHLHFRFPNSTFILWAKCCIHNTSITSARNTHFHGLKHKYFEPF